MTRPTKIRDWFSRWATVLLVVLLTAVIVTAAVLVTMDSHCGDYVARPGRVPPCVSEETRFQIIDGVPMCLCKDSSLGKPKDHVSDVSDTKKE